MKPTGGILPALLTPFTKENTVDKEALRRLVRLNLRKGVDGFYVGGSSAEAFLLTVRERESLLDVVREETGPDQCVIFHIGAIGVDEALELGRYAQNAGADAVSAVAPFYYNFTAAEIRQYYRDLIGGVDLPMILYNFPANSGVTLSADTMGDLLGDGRVAGIKHTSSDFFALERFKAEYPRLTVYNGYDEMFLAGLAMGADGGIGSTYNFMAEKFIQIRDLYSRGEMREALAVQHKVNAIIRRLIGIGVLPGAKAVLARMGIDCGPCRRPFRPLGEADASVVDEILSLLGE